MKSFSELTSASQVNNEDLLAISQTSGSGYASKKTTVKDITDKSNLNLAEEYDSTSTYAVDDYVIYESVLYKCIGTTTGAFDSTKWTSVVVTDEMGSGGGGGTGGHTIIDENGNSMTARAGLQFVGANVSDDSTNNKTIVDMSGGGVYIEKTLWEDANGLQFAPNNIQTITLSESLNKYDFIYVDVSSVEDSGYHNQNILAVSSLYDENDGYNGTVCIGGNINHTNSFAKVDNTHLKFIGFSSANPLIAWKVVGIKVSGDYYAPVIYSTEEREIGVWTDGKPLYEKTWDFGSDLLVPYNNWVSLGITLDADRIIETKTLASSGSFQGNILVYNDNGTWKGQSPRNSDASYVRYLTLYYTKTTDTAGGGTWTPQGVPTHHYLTDEHIIGTWIDGSTLYEKTISSDLTLSTASWQNYTSLADLNLLSVDKVIITRDGEQVPMAFSPYMIVAWIVRDNYLKFIIQSSTSVAETIVLKSCTIQYTKTS